MQWNFRKARIDQNRQRSTGVRYSFDPRPAPGLKVLEGRALCVIDKSMKINSCQKYVANYRRISYTLRARVVTPLLNPQYDTHPAPP